MEPSGESSVRSRVFSYSLAHKTLVIEQIRGDFVHGDRTYIHFAGVEYYCGPTVWEGDQLQLRSTEEAEQVLRELGTSMDGSESTPALGYQLFWLGIHEMTVRILAMAMTSSSKP